MPIATGAGNEKRLEHRKHHRRLGNHDCKIGWSQAKAKLAIGEVVAAAPRHASERRAKCFKCEQPMRRHSEVGGDVNPYRFLNARICGQRARTRDKYKSVVLKLDKENPLANRRRGAPLKNSAAMGAGRSVRFKPLASLRSQNTDRARKGLRER